MDGKRFLLACIVAVAWVPATQGQIAHVRGRLWRPEISGDLRVDSGALKGTTVDIANTLGLDEADVPGLAAAIRLTPWTRIEAELEQFDLSGGADVDESFTFQGRTFSIQDRIRAELEVTRLRGTLELSPLSSIPALDGGLMLGAEYLSAEASVRSLSGTRGSGKLDTVLPLIGARLRGYLVLGLYVEGRAAFSQFSLGDAELDYAELRAAVGYELLHFLGAEIGYEWVDLDGGTDDVKADTSFEGPYIAAFVQF
jgi:hypothetical protein